MQFLLFDVKPGANEAQRYLDTAAALRPDLEASGGCMFIDRFRDLDDAAWLLSFQIWRDAQALVAWRNHGRHHAAQELGRAQVFDDYRIRVGEVLAEGRARDAPAASDLAVAGRYLTLVETEEETCAALPQATVRRFASLYRPGQCMHVIGAASPADALAAVAASKSQGAAVHWRLGLVSRDYGMFERAEAPQTYPPQARAG